MAKADLQREVRALLARAESCPSFSAFLDELCALLARHPDALHSIRNRYRVIALDTGVTRAFALEGGVFRALNEVDRVDVILSGKEADLLRVLRGELSPVVALLRGKVKIDGSKTALMQFAEFL